MNNRTILNCLHLLASDIFSIRFHLSKVYTLSVLGLAKLGGKQRPMDIIFPLFPIEFTVHIPL